MIELTEIGGFWESCLVLQIGKKGIHMFKGLERTTLQFFCPLVLSNASFFIAKSNDSGHYILGLFCSDLLNVLFGESH